MFPTCVVSDTSEGCSHKPTRSLFSDFVLCLFYGAGKFWSTWAFVQEGRRRKSSQITMSHLSNVAMTVMKIY